MHITKNLIYILYVIVIVICFQQKLLNGLENLEKKGIIKRRKRKKNGKSNTLFFLNFGHLKDEISGGPL